MKGDGAKVDSESSIDKSNMDHSIDGICEKFNSLGLAKVPDKVFQEENLYALFLDYNDIAVLPTELCTKCCHLKILSVVGNKLTELPTNIGRLKLLEELYVNENNLTHFPEDFTKCFNLRILHFVGNTVTELSGKIETLTCLEKIYGDENELDDLPPDFGLLCDLQVAEFSCNQLKELPPNFGCLIKLQVLNLSSNKLSGLPESFANLPSVEELDISSNNLSTLPDSFMSSHCLKKFFAETNVIETLPLWVNNLPNLEELSFKDNQLKGKPLGDCFGETSTKLNVLELAGNFISDLPMSIGNLSQLKNVHLGSVIGELERRNFQNGNWLWKVPDSFSMLVNLRELRIDENQLCELPHDFGDLVNLETLDLGQNRLSDLPTSFGCLRSLRICQLSKNFLEILPYNFGELTTLEDLRLDNNSLAELPESFCSLVNLKTLDLFNNTLEEVPDCLSKLQKLVRLDISENKFGMHHMHVPQVVVQNKYTPRDPDQRDNWRGRPRQDILQVEIKHVDVPDEDYGKIPDEPEIEETTFNSRAFESVMRNNLSLWKSHTDTSNKREKFVHPHLYNEMIPQSAPDTLEKTGSVSSSEETEPGETGASCSEPQSPEYMTCKPEGCEEDWDRECELQDVRSNPYDSLPDTKYNGRTMLGFKPTPNSQNHLFIPSESHVLNHIRVPAPNCVEEGQFDDLEEDDHLYLPQK